MAKAPKVPNKYAKTRRGNATVDRQCRRSHIHRKTNAGSICTGREPSLSPHRGAGCNHLRAATLIAWCEDQETAYARGEDFDVAAYNTCTNTLRRLLSDLAWSQRPKTSPLPSRIHERQMITQFMLTCYIRQPIQQWVMSSWRALQRLLWRRMNRSS